MNAGQQTGNAAGGQEDYLDKGVYLTYLPSFFLLLPSSLNFLPTHHALSTPSSFTSPLNPLPPSFYNVLSSHLISYWGHVADRLNEQASTLPRRSSAREKSTRPSRGASMRR